MAMSSQQRAAIDAAARKHVEQIVERRDEAIATRRAALAAHPAPLTVKTQLTRVPRAAMRAAAAPETIVESTAESATAGYLVAIGDSWFSYPIRDVLTNLDTHYGYNIESTAHAGDAIEHMVSHVGQLDAFTRKLDKLRAIGAIPKAILISGGGDDIAGAEFGMLINGKDLPDGGWDTTIIGAVLNERIAVSYALMFAKVNGLCQERFQKTFPILVHGYDYAVPDGRGFLGGWGPLPGPWLKPGFDEKLFGDLPTNISMMQVIIDQFNAMLQQLAADPANGHVVYVDVRGTLPNTLTDDAYKDFWANELHPTGGDPFDKKQDGFRRVADRFAAHLAAL